VYSLLPPEAGPKGNDNVDRGDTDDRLPSVRSPVFAGLGNPAQGDETVVQPVELEQNCKQEGSGRMDKNSVHGSGECLRILEEGQVDRKTTGQFASAIVRL